MEFKKLHPRIQDYIKNKGWKDLTEIQKRAFDPIFHGKNCVIEAPTSGGKTEAVLFPLLTRISSSSKSGFKILYIAPLKALLNDLSLRVLPYAQMCYLEAFKWHGDVSQSDKLQQMTFPADILLTTPESIEAILLRRANWQEVFKSLETIVIDEAHYFALTERGIHLSSLLERLETALPLPVQRIAITATIGNPQGLLKWLVGNRMHEGEYLCVKSGIEKERDFKVQFFKDEGADLQSTLYNLLIRKKSIVFERSRSSSEETATRINELNLNSRFPVKVKTHHSSVSKHLREEAENSIKNATEMSLNAIISTSTLELGIDIGELDQVIQIGSLTSAGSFLQRVGRTGRRTGRPQFFRGLCSDPEELLLLVGCVSLGLKRQSENINISTSAFHILAHQIICFCLQERGATPEQIWPVLSKAFCFSSITRAQFDKLVDAMISTNYLRSEAFGVLLIGIEAEQKFLKANWKRLFAIFDSGPMYNVVDGKKVIGTLDASFAMTQTLPFVFVLGGQEWNAIKLDHDAQQVLVKKNVTGLPPKWRSWGNFDVPYELAIEIGNILIGKESINFLDPYGFSVLDSQRNRFYLTEWKEGYWTVDGSEDGSTITIWTFAGDKINRCISMFLAYHINADQEYNYQRIYIKFQEVSYSIKSIMELLEQLKLTSSEQISILLESQIEVKWFSKFSECLPDNLAKKTILEKSIDLSGTIREAQNIIIVTV
ncbi:DEAD/DEAH box helicase [Chitinophaga sp. sic0106]|uniref:DEAD/DEAH box helicase n=1 Tax=Chitinophaga sp. sic0106 TaxID=2854785 RepID=UPI001C45236C|nr:DEAD/DEAH box helicase [Chitinophaga sp. sic0106]MBV7533819.1 DEAD/DEAH box helicase [Chitinophaga sp. sic0106]